MACPPFTDTTPSTRADIIDSLLQQDQRLLLFGPPGVGKSTLAKQLGHRLAAAGRRCWCISADPGSPAFGVPGTVSLAGWQGDGWQVTDSEALCTLDAGRFRLPLVSAVRRLTQIPRDGMLLIDGPGVVRGMAGKELLAGLVEAADIDVVLAVSAPDHPLPLLDELKALTAEVITLQAAKAAKRPGKNARARVRTSQWDAYLADGRQHTIDLSRISLIGTPPPIEETDVWVGRQLGLLQDSRTLVMGEVLHLQDTRLTIRAPCESPTADALLLRDARRGTGGMVETAAPYAAERFEFVPPPDVLPSVAVPGGPRLVGRVGSVDVALVNGVFGDPLLHLRMRQQGRSLLFDLGDGGRLPAHIAHQVSDVFVSHAHMDHLGGFLWLLRSRIGDYPACRFYGPPELARHIEGFIQGFLWDRVGETGPAFEVAELQGDSVRRFYLKAGRPGCRILDELPVTDGILLDEPGFRIRAVELDHHTPVLAYAYEPGREVNVRKDRLAARGLTPGPWLTALKQELLARNESAMIALPDGSEASAAALAAELLLISAGKRLVYATDFADTADNRKRLQAFARHAHTLFCEAAFIEEDAHHAQRYGHLTTRACAEIATAAAVSRLVPFHFSRRYVDRPQQLYDELLAGCTRVAVPRDMSVFEQSSERSVASDTIDLS